MKKIIFLAAIVLLIPTINFAQSQSIDKLFNKYKNVDGFELSTADSDIHIDVDGEGDFAGFLNGMHNFRILSFDKKKGEQEDLENFQVKMDKIINKYGFESMMDIQSEDSFRLLTRKDKEGNTTDYLMISEDEEDVSYISTSSDR